MVTRKSTYDVRFVDESVKSAVAVNMKAVVTAYETPSTPIAQITRTSPGIDDVTDDPIVPVNFTVLVSPQGAIDAKCYGTPSAATVSDGTSVIFQAIEGSGYVFDGWYLSSAPTTRLSADKTATLPVDAPAIAGQTVQFLAKFVVAT